MINTFKKDLKRGKVHEKFVLNKIKSKYKKAFIKDGYCKEYDIYVPEMNFGVEVKSDEKSKYTNNIVIEIEFNEKPSALSTTKAKYWVIYDGYNYNWFLTDKIKDCIKDNKLKCVEFIGNGDTKSKKAYLIKKNVLYKYKEL
tara:strand:- start:338 stop:763 length:426 start_codon:yes stop_codon:yes gene_type:complete